MSFQLSLIWFFCMIPLDKWEVRMKMVHAFRINNMKKHFVLCDGNFFHRICNVNYLGYCMTSDNTNRWVSLSFRCVSCSSQHTCTLYTHRTHTVTIRVPSLCFCMFEMKQQQQQYYFMLSADWVAGWLRVLCKQKPVNSLFLLLLLLWSCGDAWEFDLLLTFFISTEYWKAIMNEIGFEADDFSTLVKWLAK